MKSVGTNSVDLNSLLKQGSLTGLMAKYKDLVLPIGLLLVIGTLFIQVGPTVISLLIAINLAISVMVLITSLFINSPVQLTSYPTILLLTTIFRLSLSVSVTRSILSPGENNIPPIVESLGHITAQGSLITGAVLFIIILVVQFIVVSKGAERVAEVAARFTLDAMPGKQMAIDADLRSGLITQEEARKQRIELGKESQLHGAMDGAMKFVKGDSISTIIIAAVNIVAGLATGVLVRGMGIAEAAEKYTIATFGDGLAAIISSLLITLSAGIVVTRVAGGKGDESNIGADIGEQLFASPKPLFITGGVMLLLTPLNLLFIPVGIGAAGIGYLLQRRQKRLAEIGAMPDMTRSATGNSEDLEMSFTVPMAVVVSREMSYAIDKNNPQGAAFRAEIQQLRNALYYDLGVMLPFCYVGGDAPLPENEYYIAVKEVPVGRGALKPGCVYVNDSSENIRVFGIEGENVMNPADLRPGAWIPDDQKEIASAAGLKIWEPSDVIILHLSRIMKKHAHEFIGIQEAQGYLDFISRGMPKLVEEVVGPGKVISIHQFTDVLQRLVQEGISIRDTKTILDALSEWGRIESDPVLLTEHIRAAMRRYISFRYANGGDSLFVYLLDPEIEDVIRGAIRRTSTGAFLSLDPTIAHDILDAIRKEIADQPPTAQQPVIVTDMELRRFVRKMVEIEFPNLAVLSYQELTPELNIQPIGRISMRAPGMDHFGSFETDFAELPGAVMPASLEELTN